MSSAPYNVPIEGPVGRGVERDAPFLVAESVAKYLDLGLLVSLRPTCPAVVRASHQNRVQFRV